MRVELGRFGFRLCDLIDQELVVHAPYCIDLHAPANISAAGSLRPAGGLNDLLSGITRRGCITDIVPGNEQPLLSSVERTEADAENTVTHVIS